MSAPSWKQATETAWQVPRPEPDAARALAADLGVSPILGQVLLNRGLSDADAARAFLAPSMDSLADPSEMPGMGDAVDRLLAAARGGEKVVVFGDYDVDGISGTALLTGFLSLAGAEASPRLPNRLSEGYGLNPKAVRELVDRGTDLLVTVDHGTTAHEEIALAKELGLDVVVVDHHTPNSTLPVAVAVVNPHLEGGDRAMPCGTGVAWKVAWATAVALAGGPRVAKVHREFLLDSLALVALGTVADVVPLRDENRVLARFGLEVLGKTRRPGLRALMAKAQVNGGSPRASDIGFRLAPRLNAAGRLGEAEVALELLTTDSPDRGREIAARLDRENRRRREIETGIVAEVCERVERDYAPGHAGGIAVGSEGWHAGVIGIVAARLVDRYHRPSAVCSLDGEIGRGSCRSIPSVPLPAVLEKCAEHLVTWGGHAAAAGFSVEPDRFEAFRAAFDSAVRDMTSPEDFVRRVRVDLVTTLGEVTPTLVRDVDRLAPFGSGNPRPVLATRGVKIVGGVRRVGKDGPHLSFTVADGSGTHRAIGFRMGALADGIGRHAELDIAYTVKEDDWRKDGSLQLTLEDLSVRDG
ncbi:MAG: single-stranded-DNA-specific exonuclease RecJ [Planctomycetota bacterium]